MGEVPAGHLFRDCLWSFVDCGPIVNYWRHLGVIPSETPESREMSRALKRHDSVLWVRPVC
jgi:3-methyladenine DNA glycosylase Tag